MENRGMRRRGILQRHKGFRIKLCHDPVRDRRFFTYQAFVLIQLAVGTAGRRTASTTRCACQIARPEPRRRPHTTASCHPPSMESITRCANSHGDLLCI